MTLKKERRRIMKEIRSHTGLPLPAAWRAAKQWVAAGRWGQQDMGEVVYEGPDRPYRCGIECCGWTYPLTLAIHGPRGSWITYRRV